jgi:hypothetical protein
VSHPLAKEIMTVIHYNNAAMEHYQQSLKHRDLFLRHQKLIEDRDGYVGTKDG